MSPSKTALGGWRHSCHSDRDFSVVFFLVSVMGLVVDKKVGPEGQGRAVGKQHGLVLTAAAVFGFLRRGKFLKRRQNCQ